MNIISININITYCLSQYSLRITGNFTIDFNIMYCLSQYNLIK